MSVREELQECSVEPLLFSDGFDDCIIGVSDDFGKMRVVYSVEKMIENLMSSGDTYLDAIDWLEFNTLNAWVGENTPIYVESN